MLNKFERTILLYQARVETVKDLIAEAENYYLVSLAYHRRIQNEFFLLATNWKHD